MEQPISSVNTSTGSPQTFYAFSYFLLSHDLAYTKLTATMKFPSIPTYSSRLFHCSHHALILSNSIQQLLQLLHFHPIQKWQFSTLTSPISHNWLFSPWVLQPYRLLYHQYMFITDVTTPSQNHNLLQHRRNPLWSVFSLIHRFIHHPQHPISSLPRPFYFVTCFPI